MKNLAGDNDCDKVIERELNRCGIDVVRGERSTGEVPASITGKLGDFTFERAWYYWVVSGRVPLAVALELYADPIGRTDVRAGGHGNGPHPEEYGVEYFADDGRKVWPNSEREKMEQVAARVPGVATMWEQEKSKYVFADNPKDAGKPFVASYHIDSEAGLRLFADTLKRHGLAASPAPPSPPPGLPQRGEPTGGWKAYPDCSRGMSVTCCRPDCRRCFEHYRHADREWRHRLLASIRALSIGRELPPAIQRVVDHFDPAKNACADTDPMVIEAKATEFLRDSPPPGREEANAFPAVIAANLRLYANMIEADDLDSRVINRGVVVSCLRTYARQIEGWSAPSPAPVAGEAPELLRLLTEKLPCTVSSKTFADDLETIADVLSDNGFDQTGRELFERSQRIRAALSAASGVPGEKGGWGVSPQAKVGNIDRWVPGSALADEHKVEVGTIGVVRTEVGLVFYQTYPRGDYYDAGAYLHTFHGGRAYGLHFDEHLSRRAVVFRAKAFAREIVRLAKAK